MNIKEVATVEGKKPKMAKRKQKQSADPKPHKVRLAPGIPADEDGTTTHPEPRQKRKKAHALNNEDATDAGSTAESAKRKSGKKRKNEQKHAANGIDTADPGSTDEITNEEPKKKRKKTQSSNGDEAADPNAVEDDAEPPAAEPSPGKQPRSKKGENPIKPKDPEQEQRTVFVGNLPLKLQRRQLRKFFMSFGQVDSVRLRSAPRLDAKKPIRMAVITHRFSEDRSSLNGYVRFVSEEGAAKAAAEANGQVFMEHRLRVNLALADERPDPRRAVFVGGLPLNAEDDQLWARFSECGAIVSVRIVRDRQSSVGKGIGYVNFADEEAAHRALKLNGSELEGRKIRVQKCHATAHSKVDRATGKKLRKARPADGESERPARDDKLAPVNKFSGDAAAESKSSLKKKKKKKERWDDAKRQKRNMAQSLSKTIAPAAAAKPVAAPVLAVGGVTPQNKKIKFDFSDDVAAPSDKKKDSEKLKEIKMKKEAKRKKKAKESQAKKKKNIVEPLTSLLPS